MPAASEQYEPDGEIPGHPAQIGDLRRRVRRSNVTGAGSFHALIGDPGEAVQAGPVPDCPANTLTGSLTITSSNDVEIESNTIGGSVTISDPTLVELAGNTIKGSAQCMNVTPATEGDAAPNTVQGLNNCP